MTAIVAAAPDRAASSGRGRLVMDHKVIEKIAGQAASEVARAGGSSGGVFGIGTHPDLSARPKVDVELSGRTASIDIAITVAYPTPIRQVADQVRQHLIDRVGELTGVEVTRVDITISALHREPNPGKEALR
ncbi:Asp23/Gls24 family envelope stress response protein [Microlunatus ginsengisoli]|uniref:Asp23/Gls24 family envelope stress response protein n=1 Tax=Microlunatus ginsengisoli TaxID=363863 RepID=A0ABP7AC81_9ACTN